MRRSPVLLVAFLSLSVSDGIAGEKWFYRVGTSPSDGVATFHTGVTAGSATMTFSCSQHGTALLKINPFKIGLQYIGDDEAEVTWRLDNEPAHYENWSISGYDAVQLENKWATAVANEIRRARHRIVFQVGETPAVAFPADGSNAAIANAIGACGLKVDPRYYGQKDAAQILEGLLDSIDQPMID